MHSVLDGALLRPLVRADTEQIVLVHEGVAQHIVGEVARVALLPVGDFEGGGVAPRLEGELLVDDAGEAVGPLEAGEGGDGRFNETFADEVGAAAHELDTKRYVERVRGVHPDVVDDRRELQDLAHGGDVPAFDEDVLMPDDGLRDGRLSPVV